MKFHGTKASNSDRLRNTPMYIGKWQPWAPSEQQQYAGAITGDHPESSSVIATLLPEVNAGDDPGWERIRFWAPASRPPSWPAACRRPCWRPRGAGCGGGGGGSGRVAANHAVDDGGPHGGDRELRAINRGRLWYTASALPLLRTSHRRPRPRPGATASSPAS